MMQKLTFSGHESFICKQFWLKKVYDFSIGSGRFADNYSVVDLGVGKNMVASLRFWGKSFGILADNDLPTPIADYIFSNMGKDPYIEDIGTLWLLHYNLVKTGKASLYSLVFNEFKRERVHFTKENLHSFLRRKCEEQTTYVYNSNTVTTDINVFLRNYLSPNRDEKVEIEDDYSGIFIDLDLVEQFSSFIDSDLVKFYKVEGKQRSSLPAEIVLYAILDRYPTNKTVSFHELQMGFNSPGSVFSLSPSGLYEKIEQIVQRYNGVVFSETAGNQQLQIKSTIKVQDVLDDYYGQ